MPFFVKNLKMKGKKGVYVYSFENRNFVFQKWSISTVSLLGLT